MDNREYDDYFDEEVVTEDEVKLVVAEPPKGWKAREATDGN